MVHQPSAKIYQLFHDVLLLGKGGVTVYLGPSEGALDYFAALGFECPRLENPADFFMDVIAGKVSSTQEELRAHSAEELQNVLLQSWSSGGADYTGRRERADQERNSSEIVDPESSLVVSVGPGDPGGSGGNQTSVDGHSLAERIAMTT